MDDVKDLRRKEHKLSLESREKLYVSGVTDVDSFNDNTVIISTQLGDLVIKGNELHINSLNINDGNIAIHGHIYSCIYTENAITKKDRNFFKSLFK